MDSQEFVAAVERYLRDAAIEDTIANLNAPPGRRVLPEVRARSDWYNVLSDEDKDHVDSVIAGAVQAALFGLLAAFDGARTIDDGNGRFELTYVGERHHCPWWHEGIPSRCEGWPSLRTVGRGHRRCVAGIDRARPSTVAGKNRRRRCAPLSAQKREGHHAGRACMHLLYSCALMD